MCVDERNKHCVLHTLEYFFFGELFVSKYSCAHKIELKSFLLPIWVKYEVKFNLISSSRKFFLFLKHAAADEHEICSLELNVEHEKFSSFKAHTIVFRIHRLPLMLTCLTSL